MRIKRTTVKINPLVAASNCLLLQVVSITVSINAVDFLDEHRFTYTRPKGSQKTIVATAPARHTLYIEYQQKGLSTYMLFTLFKKPFGENRREIETGHIYIPPGQPTSEGNVFLSAQGDEVKDCDIVACPVKAAESSAEVLEEEIPLPSAVENGHISTVAVMIADAVKRGKEATNDSARGAIKPEFADIPGIRKNPEKPKRWPYNQHLLKYMDTHHGGDHTVIGISRAMNELKKSGKYLAICHLADEFSEDGPTMSLILSVTDLHPDLHPILELERGDKGWMSPACIGFLTRVPMEKQKELWEKAQKMHKEEGSSPAPHLKFLAREYLDQPKPTTKGQWWKIKMEASSVPASVSTTTGSTPEAAP